MEQHLLYFGLGMVTGAFIITVALVIRFLILGGKIVITK